MKNELLIIGMSPGNSYFKEETIKKLLNYSLLNYKNIEIFIPDIPAISTYVALGYTEKIARSKAVLQGNSFRNRINRAIDKDGFNQSSITIFDWKKENLENNSNYQKEYSYLKELYSTNKDFEKDINEATKQVLISSPFKKKEITLADVVVGTHYIISEFAFMMSLPQINDAYDSFIYGYHKSWPVWEKFIAGDYDGKPKSNLLFIKLPDFSQV